MFGKTFSTASSPVVSVPVLSRQTTSQCARFSREYNSRTSTFSFDSLIIPAAKPMLISKTSPFGNIPKSPADVVTTVSENDISLKKYPCMNNNIPSGKIKRLVNFVTLSIAAGISELVCFVDLTSSTILAANPSSLSHITSALHLPDMTVLPDKISSPFLF